MATPVGTNTVTSIARRWILPEISDNVYRSNTLFYRLVQARKRLVRGGTQIEFPLMHARFSSGGPYTGLDKLGVTPSDTIKNGALDWRQYHVPVTVDGLTLLKWDSPEAIADGLQLQFRQQEMEMSEWLGLGVWSDGVTNTKHIDGLEGAVDDGGVLGTYAGLDRTVTPANDFWDAEEDATTATLTLSSLQSMWGNTSEGGRQPTSIWSRQEQYNRYWALNVAQQRYPVQPAGADNQLASGGFHNLLFNGAVWFVDSHVFDGPNASNSAVVFLNEDYIWYAVHPRADFYLEDFQSPVDQDAMVSNLYWGGNIIVTNVARQGKMTNLTA